MAEGHIKDHYNEDTKEKINKYNKYKNLLNFLSFPDTFSSSHYYFSIIVTHLVLYFLNFHLKLLSYLGSNLTNPYFMMLSFLLILASITFIPNWIVRYLDYRWDKTFNLITRDFSFKKLSKSFLLYLIFLGFILASFLYMDILIILSSYRFSFSHLLFLILLIFLFLIPSVRKKVKERIVKIIIDSLIPFEKEELKDEELRELIFKLSEDRDIPQIKNIYTVKASDKTNKVNAMYDNLSSNVYIYDTLIEIANKIETQAIIAHEMGHHKYKTEKGFFKVVFSETYKLLWIIFLSYAFFLLFFRLPLYQIEYLPVFTILFLPSFHLLFIEINLSKKPKELEADKFAASAVDEPSELIKGLIKTSKNNLRPLSHSYKEEILFSTHPSLKTRIEKIKEYEKSNE